MPPLLLAALMLQSKPSFDFDVRGGSGLTLSVSGVPIVKGTTVQYFEKGWVRGYYSSSNDGSHVDRIDDDTYKETFSGHSGSASGTVTYQRRGNRLLVHYDLQWGDADPAQVELSAGLISAPALQAGSLTADGAMTRSLKTHKYLGGGDFENRRYAHDSSDYVFDAPLAKVEVKTSAPTTLFDARGYDQAYAAGRALWWLGCLDLDISKERPLSFDVTWQIDAKPVPSSTPIKVALKATHSAAVIVPDEKPPVLIPKPTLNQLNFTKTLEFTGQYDWPAGLVRFWDTDFIAGLAKRFDLPKPSPKANHIKVDGGVSKLGLHPGGFQIEIREDSISVLGEEDEGLHDGLRYLARLAFVRGGKIVFPTGFLRMSPRVIWRGVHLFVGPEARSFQKKLWDRVLLPLGFNKVVLQCEQTKWDCLPALKDDKDAMSKTELASLFADYRAMDVEPIPLIQSFGHMEWYFRGGQNLDLAVNSKVPYTIDPRNPKTKESLTKLWDEACDLLKPSTLHFGCDEVGMRGFPDDHGALVTQLWSLQMPVLQQIAERHGDTMMIWGDEGLAPEEAVDAANGESKETAAKRRAAIPKGTWIGDWHYAAGPKPEKYVTSLELWKREGFVPVASSWYEPLNIASFGLAADVEHAGTLQTTWSGYTSDERAMEENFDQYSAMVLAADYSWNSRFEPPFGLAYDPAAVFRQMYYGRPRSIVPKAGDQIFQGDGTSELVDGDLHFQLGTPIALRSLISTPDAPGECDLEFRSKGAHLALAMDTVDKCDRNEPVADLTIRFTDGSVRTDRIVYGRDVRSSDDTIDLVRADSVKGLSILELPIGEGHTVAGIKIQTISPAAGIRIHGLIVW
ncbi:MAG: hypothetical protein P4L46_08915 [Fimbriimonas sp.]|nr:hypothetical protein [Fimbriimonas sp.]